VDLAPPSLSRDRHPINIKPVTVIPAKPTPTASTSKTPVPVPVPKPKFKPITLDGSDDEVNDDDFADELMGLLTQGSAKK
jgi:hypothetical protein